MCSLQLYGRRLFMGKPWTGYARLYTDAITNLLYLFYKPLARFVGGAYNENVYTRKRANRV